MRYQVNLEKSGFGVINSDTGLHENDLLRHKTFNKLMWMNIDKGQLHNQIYNLDTNLGHNHSSIIIWQAKLNLLMIIHKILV